MFEDRITIDPRVRWGTPCLGTTGITVAQVVALVRELRREAAVGDDDRTAGTDETLRYLHQAIVPQPGGPAPADCGCDAGISNWRRYALLTQNHRYFI